MLAPLSKYIVVQYHPDGWWDIFKSQYLDTMEEARNYVTNWVEMAKEDDDPTTYKIFELKEVQ